MPDIKTYKFSRGTKYSCVIHVIDNEQLVFENVTVPPENDSPEVASKLIEDAERFVMQEIESTYGG